MNFQRQDFPSSARTRLGSASAAKLPTYHLAMKGNPMTTYEDAKKEFEDEIAKTLAHVKHIKEMWKLKSIEHEGLKKDLQEEWMTIEKKTP